MQTEKLRQWKWNGCDFCKTKYYTGTLKIQVGETGGSGSDNGNTGETGGPGNDNGNGNSWWDLMWGWDDKLTTSQPEDSQTKPQQTIKVGKPKISLKRSKTKDSGSV